MDYSPSPTTPPTQLRLASVAVTFLALLTGLVYLNAALMGEMHEKLGAATAVLLVIGIFGLLIAWKWLSIGGMISLLAGIGIVFVTYFSLDTYPLFAAVLYGSPFIIAGGLRLACWQQMQH